MSALLELADVSRRFRDGAGVHGLRLHVAPGEIVALVGLNGAGKTTLMRLALGMLRPDEGRVSVWGYPVAAAPRSVWGSVGHLVDAPLAYAELTVVENLRAAARLHDADPRRAEEAIAQWRLGPDARRRVATLSLGNRQRVGLAAALQHAPGLVVLDEPTNALDPAGVLVLRDVLLARAESSAAVLVSSHHLDEVARVATRVVVMNRGRLIGCLDCAAADIERAFFERVHRDDEERGAA